MNKKCICRLPGGTRVYERESQLEVPGNQQILFSVLGLLPLNSSESPGPISDQSVERNSKLAQAPKGNYPIDPLFYLTGTPQFTYPRPRHHEVAPTGSLKRIPRVVALPRHTTEELVCKYVSRRDADASG